MKKLVVAFATMWFSLASFANAAVVTSLSGDRDCFGLGVTCADGDFYITDLGGEFWIDYSTASDPYGTDYWEVSSVLGGPSFTYGADLAGLTAISAELEIFTAGIDLGAGADFLFNGVSIGTYVETAVLKNFAVTLLFNVPIALLLNPDGLVLSLNQPDNDGFIIDYTELRVTVVPLPAALPLFGTALAGMGFIGWRRKRKAAGLTFRLAT